MIRIPKDTEMTLSLLQELLAEHRQEADKRYNRLHDYYVGKHDILSRKAKPEYKPDNRIVVNFPKYIVDTFNGFFIGNPIKVVAKDEAVADFVEYIEKYNDQDNNNSELSKICSIYGKGYEMYYTDEDSELCITYLSPREAFMIYDESIVERPLFFVRVYKDREGVEYGSISDKSGVRHFQITGALRWTDEWQPHFFKGVPAVEYIENEERLGIFEPVITEVDAYNKAISEKANDVDYFADAYMKILGPEIESEDLQFIRDNRIINFSGEDSTKITVEFMGKPESDTAQENLLNRIERLIFQTGMVADISDENFGTSSGIALQYKVLAMHNLVKNKTRKFTSGMNQRYKLLFGHPVSKVPADAWVQLEYQFTPNLPQNLLEETQIATGLEGITSRRTQLRVLSVVENVQDELDAIEEENKEAMETAIEQMMFPAVIPETEEEPAEDLDNEQQ